VLDTVGEYPTWLERGGDGRKLDSKVRLGPGVHSARWQAPSRRAAVGYDAAPSPGMKTQEILRGGVEVNWMQFTSSIIGSIAWPLAAVVLALTFRASIRKLLLGPVKRVKAGPVEMEYWDRATSSARQELRRAREGENGPLSAQISPTHALQRELRELAKADPAAAVLEGYERIERELREVLRRRRIHFESAMSAPELAELARQHGVIKQEAANAVEGLTVLRNLAAHGAADQGLSVQRAVEYVNLVAAVLYSLRRDSHQGQDR